MLQLDNRTDWAAGLYPGWGINRQRQQTLVFKVGYSFDKEGILAPLPQAPIEETDRYRGDPETSSLVAASEIVPFKQGGELLLHGSAHPAGSGERVLQVKVSLRQRNDAFWSKELRVFGCRSWKRRLLTALPSTPEPIEGPIALVYENAYGGTDPANPEETCTANPAGVGFSLRGLRTKSLSLPRIECGPGFVASPASRVSPAGYGPIAPHWEPRCNAKVDIDTEAITYGGCPWGKEPPESLYNTAPLDQRFEQPFEGEMTLQLKGLVADAPRDILIHLPEIKPRIHLDMNETFTEFQAACDTLIVHTDPREINLIFRCALPWSHNHTEEGLVTLRDLVAEEQAEKEQTEALA
ncbi:protein of unknown function DUF2169 [Syntrophotalea carbinolica DSM 2380]|uniref:DUF2169 domain-containing protein n=1 Tax=Syntrophotalea carbinolica (strain DSM 2380 / NBRC 103641 / GraBd1) TaxID=338963 RepID=Q3A0P5_SYNC1|nr:DUF2169 domain-containing protein [Syntrophotalea carbinolica]ABA90062.1 protein of unknown function DUF2169 [Syntrophotalea carbinolica DSM 2380]